MNLEKVRVMSKLSILALIVVTILLGIAVGEEQTFSQGIILANNSELITIFRDHEDQLTTDLIADLQTYDRVVLHLGAKKVFIRGNAFFYKTSQANLKLFAKKLQKNDQQLYLWFLDSFGGESFLDIYNNYRAIIDANYEVLEELDLDYKGIVIDLEWINLNTNQNNQKYLEILRYLDKKFANKEIYAFASIIDNREENQSRGYDEEKMLNYLDNIIAMLYVGDGGYYLKGEQMYLYLSMPRIEQLRKYYEQHNYQVAVATVGRIILERNNNLYFIKSATEFDYFEETKRLYNREEKYYTVSGYQPQNEFYLRRNDGVREKITKEDKLHFLRLKQNKLLQEKDYIWEYFLLQQ